MVDEENENRPPEIVAKYSEEGSFDVAVANAELRVFDLMRLFEDGVPPNVMFSANFLAMDFVAQQLVSMITEVMAVVGEWSDADRINQELLARKLARLFRSDATVQVLEQELLRREALDE